MNTCYKNVFCQDFFFLSKMHSLKSVNTIPCIADDTGDCSWLNTQLSR